jgi:flavorubredoxin
MRAVVIYESLTGNTRRAAELIATALAEAGVAASVCSVTQVDYQALSVADVVIVGSWTDGIFVVGQRPGRAQRLRALPVMDRKRCVVYCTYALNPGKTLAKLTRIMEERGAEVLGGMSIRRNDLEGGAREFVQRLLAAVAV